MTGSVVGATTFCFPRYHFTGKEHAALPSTLSNPGIALLNHLARCLLQTLALEFRL